MKKITARIVAASIITIGLPLGAASTAHAATYECHVFQNGKVHCEKMNAE